LKAVVKVRPEPGLEVLDIPVPETGQREALIRVRAAAICGSDLGIYDYTPAYSSMRLPVVLGHEFAGEVVEVGPCVEGYGVGDRVLSESVRACGSCRYCREGLPNLCEASTLFGIHVDGGFAEHVAVPQGLLHGVPDGMSYEEAAVVEPLSNAHHFVSDITPVRSGDFAVVQGGPGGDGAGVDGGQGGGRRPRRRRGRLRLGPGHADREERGARDPGWYLPCSGRAPVDRGGPEGGGHRRGIRRQAPKLREGDRAHHEWKGRGGRPHHPQVPPGEGGGGLRGRQVEEGLQGALQALMASLDARTGVHLKWSADKNRGGTRVIGVRGSSGIFIPVRSRSDKIVCFEAGRPPRDFWLIVGVLLVIWGVQVFLRLNLYDLWPYILMDVGLYVVYVSLVRSRRE
jgi:hypothetical protein